MQPAGWRSWAKQRLENPDIVIMDLAMPGMDGIQATRRITALGLGVKILVLTAPAGGCPARAKTGARHLEPPVRAQGALVTRAYRDRAVRERFVDPRDG